MSDSLTEIQAQVKAFRDERDWEQFHDAKSLVVALTAEVGELAEHFLWLSDEASRDLSAEQRSEVGGELADIALYLLNLATSLGLDLQTEIEKKLAFNAERFPPGDSTPRAAG